MATDASAAHKLSKKGFTSCSVRSFPFAKRNTAPPSRAIPIPGMLCSPNENKMGRTAMPCQWQAPPPPWVGFVHVQAGHWVRPNACQPSQFSLDNGHFGPQGLRCRGVCYGTTLAADLALKLKMAGGLRKCATSQFLKKTPILGPGQKKTKNSVSLKKRVIPGRGSAID